MSTASLPLAGNCLARTFGRSLSLENPPTSCTVWDTMLDWFCKTDMAAAAKQYAALKQALAEGKPHSATTAFFKLQQLAAESYRENFEYELLEGKTMSFSITGTPFRETLPRECLSQECLLPECLPQAVMDRIETAYGGDSLETRKNQLWGDLTRATYCFNAGSADEITFGAKSVKARALDQLTAASADNSAEAEVARGAAEFAARRKVVEAFMAKVQANDYQWRMLGTLAVQSSNIAIFDALRELVGPGFASFGMGPEYLQQYAVRELPETSATGEIKGPGTIQVQVTFLNSVPEEPEIREVAVKDGIYEKVWVTATYNIYKDVTECIHTAALYQDFAQSVKDEVKRTGGLGLSSRKSVSPLLPPLRLKPDAPTREDDAAPAA